MLMCVLAEQRADAADHARHVVVVEHQDVSLGHRLHAEVVDPREADGVGAEDRALRRVVLPAARFTSTVIALA